MLYLQEVHFYCRTSVRLAHSTATQVYNKIKSHILINVLVICILFRVSMFEAQYTFCNLPISCIQVFVIFTAASNGKYDLIVIDPPWENRSAIRGKKLVKHYVYHYIHVITLLVHIYLASTVYMQFVCWLTMLSCYCHCHYAHCGIKKNYAVFIMSKKFVLNFYHISL